VVSDTFLTQCSDKTEVASLKHLESQIMLRSREIAGWLLVLAGLYLMRMSLEFVGDRKVVEASIVVFAAMTVFRGGIQLIKVATAARVCLTAERRTEASDLR